ncbi:MAG: HD domain-containing protein [Methylophaga sp.]|nr:HD domain-containing protein [Methylophaga sp.]
MPNAINQHSLNKSSIYKLVNKRLSLVLFFVVISIGVTSYYLEQHRLLKNIQTIAIKRANQYVMQFGKLLNNQQAVDDGSVQKSIEKFAESNIVFSEGTFVAAFIRDNRDKIAGSFIRDQYTADTVTQILKQATQIDPIEAVITTVEVIEIDSKQLILLRFPVQDSSHNTLGQAAVLFLPATERIQLIQTNVWQTTVSAIAIVLMTALGLYPVIIRLTHQLSELSTSLLIANLQTAKALGNAIAKRDSDTDAHNYRVTIYSVRLAEEIGLPTKKMQGLIKGAFLHDVGKIGTPDNILLKPGKLTESEFTEMKNHVGHGVDIIKNSSWLQDAEDVVLHHHEKYNGNGYAVNGDKALTGKNIPLTARIFAIADVFDALTSRRPYKEPFDFDTTMAEMEKNIGTHFDPELFATFKTIAKPLYDKLANREDELPKDILKEIVQLYFLQDLEQLLS